MAGHRNLRVNLNEDLALAARWKGADGAPYLLSDGHFSVRATDDATDPLLDATLVNGRVTLDAVDGWCRVLVPKAIVSAIPNGTMSGVFDLVVTRQGDGRTKRLLEGTVAFSRGAVR